MEETKTIANDVFLMEQLNSLKWDDLWIKLMAHSVYTLRKRFGVKWSNNEVQEFCREIIVEVIDKIFVSKERKWNIDRYPEFNEFITGAIDSHISNTLRKKNKRCSF